MAAAKTSSHLSDLMAEGCDAHNPRGYSILGSIMKVFYQIVH
jgi:hypothetical protein